MPPYQMNPVNEFYMRNAQPQMYSQPYQQQFSFSPYPQQHQASQPPVIHAVWVTNIEEAKAARSDDFLSTNIFIDTSTGKIYMKKIDNDGKPLFLSYVIEPAVQEQAADPLAEINVRLSNIESALGGLVNVQSVSGNEGNIKPGGSSEPGFAGPAPVQNEPDGSAEPAGFQKNAGNDKWQKRR